MNAWPLDEAYIDYVVGSPNAGIINNPADFPSIDADLVVSLNEEGGEENVSTGWHAIEFLLWGQDTSEDGPGVRPLEDYTTNANASRRAVYLATALDVLVGHLRDVVNAWAPSGSGNYREVPRPRPPTKRWRASSQALASSAGASSRASALRSLTRSVLRRTNTHASPTTRRLTSSRTRAASSPFSPATTAASPVPASWTDRRRGRRVGEAARG